MLTMRTLRAVRLDGEKGNPRQDPGNGDLLKRGLQDSSYQIANQPLKSPSDTHSVIASINSPVGKSAISSRENPASFSFS